MIEKTTAYKAGEQFFPCIEDAQKHEIAEVLLDLTPGDERETAIRAAEIIIKNRDKILDILTMTPASRPHARKINGGSKKRASKAAAVNAALQDGKQ